MTTPLPRAKISEFLHGLDPWGIYLSEPMRKDFVEQVGVPPDWPEHTEAGARRAMANRGLGGTLKPSNGESLAYGWEVAIALAEKHVQGFRCSKHGRGSAFREAVDALEKAGK